MTHLGCWNDFFFNILMKRKGERYNKKLEFEFGSFHLDPNSSQDHPHNCALTTNISPHPQWTPFFHSHSQSSPHTHPNQPHGILNHRMLWKCFTPVFSTTICQAPLEVFQVPSAKLASFVREFNNSVVLSPDCYINLKILSRF